MGTCGVEEMRMEAAMADLDRNAIPANADCRGGVFATRRFPRPLYSPYAKIPPVASAAQTLPTRLTNPTRIPCPLPLSPLTSPFRMGYLA